MSSVAIVPMFNEADNANAAQDQLAMVRLGMQGDHVANALGNDSRDATIVPLARAREEHTSVRVIRHQRNCNIAAALQTDIGRRSLSGWRSWTPV